MMRRWIKYGKPFDTVKLVYIILCNDPIDQRLNMDLHRIQARNRAHFVIQQQWQFRTAHGVMISIL